MIRYMLRCDGEHSFESWFASADAFDRLNTEGRLSCAVCGSIRVEKSLMAPAVAVARDGTGAARDGVLGAPASEVETALLALRREIEANSDYVGLNFAAEARAMHEGERPERQIHGEARLDEARALLQDGVPVAPLPFLPRRKTN